MWQGRFRGSYRASTGSTASAGGAGCSAGAGDANGLREGPLALRPRDVAYQETKCGRLLPRSLPRRCLCVASAVDTASDVPHIVVVGGGWGGWGAAKALVQASTPVRVTLLDALPDPTGATVPETPTGKPTEAGFRGFWRVRLSLTTGISPRCWLTFSARFICPGLSQHHSALRRAGPGGVVGVHSLPAVRVLQPRWP